MSALLPAIRAAGHSNIGRGMSTRTTVPSYGLGVSRSSRGGDGIVPNKLETRNPKPETTLRAASAEPTLARILRPQATQRWMLPQLSAITPTYIESVLRGSMMGSHIQAWELFDLMEDSWPELSACVQELKNAVQRKTAVFEPFCEEGEEPSKEAEEKAKLVSTALRRMVPEIGADENALHGLQFDILDAWFKGTCVQEIDWTNAEGDMNIIAAGKLGDITAPRATFYVHPQHYAWGQDGKLGLRSNTPTLQHSNNPEQSSVYWPSPNAGEVIPFPLHKFIVAIHKAKSGSAQVGALLRPLAWWWCAANFSADWLMNLAQIFGLPIRWANYEQGAAQATVDAVCSMLENMGSNPWGAFPGETKVELLQPTNIGNNSPQGDLLNRADAQARKLILGQTMSGSNAATGAGNGAGAFGKQEGTVKDDIIDAAGQFVCEVVNKQVIPAIIELNYGESAELPRLCLVDEEEFTNENAQVVSTLAAAGMKFSADELYKKTGYRKPRKGEETIGGGTAGPNAERGTRSAEQPNPKPETRNSEQADEDGAAARASQSAINNQQSTINNVSHLLVRRLGPLVSHIKAIAAIPNPLLRAAMFEDFFQSQPAVTAALKADATLRDAIEQLSSEAFVKGVQS